MFVPLSECGVNPRVVQTLRLDKGGIITIGTLCAATATAIATTPDVDVDTAALAVVVRVRC